MHVYKRYVLRVCLYLEFERANVYIDVLGLWIEIDSLKKKKFKTKNEKRERVCWDLVEFFFLVTDDFIKRQTKHLQQGWCTS